MRRALLLLVAALPFFSVEPIQAEPIIGADTFLFTGVNVILPPGIPFTELGGKAEITFAGIENLGSNGNFGIPPGIAITPSSPLYLMFDGGPDLNDPFQLTFGSYGTFALPVFTGGPIGGPIISLSYPTPTIAEIMLSGIYTPTDPTLDQSHALVIIDLVDSNGAYAADGVLFMSPEPSSFALLGTGTLGFLGWLRRKNRFVMK